MKVKNIILSFILFSLLYTSCTERIDLKLNNTYPRLVVEGAITTDTMIHFVRLSLSGDFFTDERLPAVSGAEVSISDGIESITLKESKSVPGIYITNVDYSGIAGGTYSLLIENVDINNDGIKETYRSESYLPPVTQIDSVSLEYEDMFELWKVLLYAVEPADTPNFYMFNLIINDTVYTDQMTEVTISDDRFIDGSYANGVWVHSIYDDDETLTLTPGDTITLIMSGITEEFYNYIIALQTETRISVPLFSGSPANLPGNISNGALGFFRAYSNTYGYAIFTGEK